MPPILENPTKLALTSAIEQVLKTMFADYRRIILRQEFGAGLSSGRVLEVQRVNADGTPELPVVVKVASLSLVQKEWLAYQQHIRRRLPYIAEIRAEPVLLPDIGWGGLRYTLMGGGTFEVVSLRDYSRRADISAEQTSRTLDRLLKIMRHIWGYHQPQTEFTWGSSYDRILPVNLLIQVNKPDNSDYFLLSPETLPLPPLELGQPVSLSGFVVEKVDATARTISLNRPQPPAYSVRCLFSPADAERIMAYQAGQVLEPIIGQVIETRSSRLQTEAQQALGPELDLTWPTLSLAPFDSLTLPNPLAALPTLLSQTRSVNVASIHGDFNLENILVEAETGMVHLIDFAEARADHILYDFLCLEAEVLTKLLPQILQRHHLAPLPTLATLYWQLHWATFQPVVAHPALPHPDLQKCWAMLITIRRTARHYLFEANDPGEYYHGLVLYLLGVLKFKNLNRQPESPLPKQLAFWGAALACELLTHPPADVDTSPPNLAALLIVQPEATLEAHPKIETGPLNLSQTAQKLAALPLDVIPPLLPLPPASRMPLSRNPLFVGRREDLLRLAGAVKGGEMVAIGQVASRLVERGLETAATTGLGGMGKTQLACEFVHRYGQFFAGGVFWLSFADPKAVPAEVAACGGVGALELRPDFGERPLEEQVRLVLAAWQEPTPRLLVFDNCEDPALLAQWRPSSGGCRVVVTTRRADWEPGLGVQALPLDVLSRAESLILLRNHQPDADDAILDAIAAELGDLPLALHLAGSYMARYRRSISPAQYLEQLRSPALLQHPSLRGLGLSPTGHIQNVYRTIALSYDQLDRDDPVDT